MKKFLSILAVLMISVSLSAQVFELRATHFRFNLSPQNPKWSDWQQVSIPVTMDFQTKRIVVFSAKQQIIDYEELEREDFSDYINFSGYATDSKYRTIYIVITIREDGNNFLLILYDDVAYGYKMVEI